MKIFDCIDNQDLKRAFEFIIEIDALKKIIRRTRIVGGERYENVAEHSWHLIMLALVLQDRANEKIDMLKVVKMLAIHDLGEIKVGDVFLYDASRDAGKNAEQAAAAELFALLPQNLANEFNRLWIEFEAGETAESKFAQALDRFQPFLSNLANDGSA